MFSCRELLFSQLFSCERPQATEILEKGCFSMDFRRDVRHFFVLFWRGFGTSSSFRAMVFSCRELLFSQLFSCERPQATEILEKGCFSRISEGTLGTFLAWFWNFRPSEPCFPAGSCFFRSCFPASGRRQQKFSKNVFFFWHFFGVGNFGTSSSFRKGWCFPAGGFQTGRTFLAWFWN